MTIAVAVSVAFNAILLVGVLRYRQKYRRARREARRKRLEMLERTERRIVAIGQNEPMDVVRNGTKLRVVSHPHWVHYETYEPATFALFDRLLDREKDFLDIGAWIGATPLYAAARSRRVIAVEPDPVAMRHLRRNVRLNPELNVVPVYAAVSPSSGTVTIHTNELSDSTTSIVSDRAKLDEDAISVMVEGITFEELLARHGVESVSLVKMDIEGGEKVVLERVLPVLVERRWPLLISLHPMFIGEAETSRLIGLLRDAFPHLYHTDLQPFDEARTGQGRGEHGGADLLGAFEPVG